MLIEILKKIMKKDTLFLDRDGVINVQLLGDYVKNIAELELRDDFLNALPSLVGSFKRFIVVTNQQGIAKGLCTAEMVAEVHAHLSKELSARGMNLDAIYVCPHLAGSGCACRKPELGMFHQALRDFPDIDIANSVMIGDSATDVIFGHKAGLETVFIGKITPDNRADIEKNSDHIFNSICEYSQTI